MTINIIFILLRKKNCYGANGTVTQFFIFINSHGLIIEITSYFHISFLIIIHKLKTG